jgi:hypothetical protein
MLKTACGPDGNLLAGKSYEVDEKRGKALLAGDDPAAKLSGGETPRKGKANAGADEP